MFNIFKQKEKETVTLCTVSSTLVNGRIQKKIDNPELKNVRVTLPDNNVLTPGNIVTKNVSGIPGSLEVTYITCSSDEHRVELHKQIVEEYPTNYLGNKFKLFQDTLDGRGRIMLTGVKTTTGVASKERTITIEQQWTIKEFFETFGEYRDNPMSNILSLDVGLIKRELGFTLEDKSIFSTIVNIYDLIVIPTPLIRKVDNDIFDYMLLGIGTVE